MVAGSAAAVSVLAVGVPGDAGVSTPSMAPAAVLRAASLPGGIDATWTALADRFAAGLAAFEAIERRRNACEQRYFASVPEPPEALTATGPLGRRLARAWSWWDADALEWLLEDAACRKDWRKARKLLPIARAHAAARERCHDASGLTEAEAAQEAASGALEDLTEAILAAPAATLAGLAVKARAVKLWGRPEWWSPPHADAPEELAAQVLDAVIAMAGEGA
jgi:hypothetical protein